MEDFIFFCIDHNNGPQCKKLVSFFLQKDNEVSPFKGKKRRTELIPLAFSLPKVITPTNIILKVALFLLWNGGIISDKFSLSWHAHEQLLPENNCISCSKKFSSCFLFGVCGLGFFLILLQEVLHPELKKCMRFDRLLAKIF